MDGITVFARIPLPMGEMGRGKPCPTRFDAPLTTTFRSECEFVKNRTKYFC
jgi:hypothetical protein